MTPNEHPGRAELRQAAKTLRADTWPTNHPPKWLVSLRANVGGPLAPILENLAHTWDENEWDTNENAFILAQKINEAATDQHRFTVSRDQDPQFPRNWQDFTWVCTCGESEGWHNTRADATSSAEKHMADVHGQAAR